MIPTATDGASGTRDAPGSRTRVDSRRHIVHLIGTLERGGAELFMARLVTGIAEAAPDWTQDVWTIDGRGPLAATLESAGVPVRTFGVDKSPRGLWRAAGLATAIARSRAALLQTWMYHADAVGILARVGGFRAPQVWTLRQSNLAPGVNAASTRALIRLCAWCSRSVPAAIVAGSQASLDAHRAVGYAAPRMPVIHNGVDTGRFTPHQGHRAAARRQWGVDDGTVLIGYLARVSPVKDHATLLAAARRLAARDAAGPPWRLVCVGQGTASPGFAALIAAHGLQDRVIGAGPNDTPELVLPAFDIAVSSSLGEGFPNGVAEAMACGVPVVATDVGDTGQLLPSADFLVPPGDAAALADRLGVLLGAAPEARAALGRAARDRVEHGFREIDAVRAYVALYESLLAPAARPGGTSPV